MPESAAELQGEISRVVFTSPDGGFTVVRIEIPGRRDPVTAVGKMPGIREGETIKVRGRWTKDPKFGEQLAVDGFEAVLPATTEGITRYLGSGMVKGIGPKLAERIVATFGPDTLDVLDRWPDRLSEVKGIGAEKLASLKGAWETHREVRSVMVFLQGQGISPAYATRIVKRFGMGAARIVRENPYRLADEVSGIGFKTADAIARKVGIPLDSPARVDAAIRYTLSEAASDGHCFLPPDELSRRTAEALAPPGEAAKPVELEESLTRLIAANALVREDAAIFLRELAEAEIHAATRLKSLAAAPARVSKPLDAPKALAWVESQTRRVLAERQREAVIAACGGKAAVITGGPGTGKTTVVDAIVRIARARTERVQLAAPTGRAAKRLSEATGQEAKTVHRLLEFDPRAGGFARNAGKRLDLDLLVLDECSMVDLPLLRAVLEALPDAARLVLVGDADQLPSVGPGNVLKDVIASARIPTVRLDRIFRQASGSGIVANAHRINAGEAPEWDDDVIFVPREDPEEAVEAVCDLVARTIPAKLGLDPARDVQVLVPMNRGAAGAGSLNQALQARINPRGREVARRFRIGDRVLQMRNDYEKEVFNGDLGRVAAFNADEALLEVEFEGRPVQYESADFDQLALAYATTIHRSQGSEYPAVVIPILTQHFVMLQRNLLYTAVTRGKRLVALVGSRKAISMAVRNASGGQRWTRLKERLS